MVYYVDQIDDLGTRPGGGGIWWSHITSTNIVRQNINTRHLTTYGPLRDLFQNPKYMGQAHLYSNSRSRMVPFEQSAFFFEKT